MGWDGMGEEWVERMGRDEWHANIIKGIVSDVQGSGREHLGAHSAHVSERQGGCTPA